MEKISKKQKFFPILAESKVKQSLFFVISIVLLVVLYFIGQMVIKINKSKEFTLVHDNFSCVYQIDNIYVENWKLIIEGWIFEQGRDSEGQEYEIILADIDSDRNAFPKMQYSERNDVNEYFLCEYDYSQSGFQATISTWKLDVENSVYEILVRKRGESKAFDTGIYVAEGEIFFANPRDFIELKVEDTNLKQIIDEGILRVYNPEEGMYVYQYNGVLYWIAEPTYGFVDGDTMIQYQMETSQIERLPQYRLENDWFWDNRSFLFSKNEIVEWDTGKYRVACCEIPTEYAITKMWTGNHINEWIWQAIFRPWYDL